MCKQETIEPEKPLKGSLNIRLGHELHQQIALAAFAQHISINKYIRTILEKQLSIR